MSAQTAVGRAASPAGAGIRDALLALRNPDGGWGAVADRPSDTESTALAALALGSGSEVEGAQRWLIGARRGRGWGFLAGGEPASWTTALAILALRGNEVAREAVRDGADWLIEEEAVTMPWHWRLRYWLLGHEPAVELDYGVRGWPWAPGAFGWVEPTAWSLLALRAAGGARLGLRARARLVDGVAMIVDRMCDGGGWNYGNRHVLGATLEPYPDTTALALLALDPEDAPDAVRTSHEALHRMIDAHASGLACALAALCQRAHGRDPVRALALLEARFETTRFLGETRVLALALLALDETGVHRLVVPA